VAGDVGNVDCCEKMSHECPIDRSTQSDPAQNTWFSKVLSNSDGPWREIGAQ
jgi:hypothetical protein